MTELTHAVDADTVVHPMSLTRLVANMMRDRRIIGLCGETEIANKNKSWVSMIQVYEVRPASACALTRSVLHLASPYAVHAPSLTSQWPKPSNPCSAA